MAKARNFIHLKCGECGSLNYTFKKSKRGDKKALELRKFCPKCRKHTPHKEAKS